MRFLVFFILIILSYNQQQPKLIFIQEIIRHGARYHERILYPKLDDLFAKTQMSAGQLTSQGKSMHYLLGKKMYERYWKKLFGNTSYEYKYNQSKFYIRSTDFNRTIQSVQSHLYGLLQSLPPLIINKNQVEFSIPPYPGIKTKPGYVFGEKSKNYHPVAIHVQKSEMTADNDGDFLATFMACNCPKQAYWIKNNYKNENALKILNYHSFNKAVRELQAALGLDNNTINLNNFYNYYDNLKCMQYLGKAVPAIFKQGSQVRRTLNALITLNAYTGFYLDEEQRRVTSSGFFESTLNNFKNIINNNNSPQWIIYSAHDLTLGVILSVMQMWNMECIFSNYVKNITNSSDCLTQSPQFASVLVFELYRYWDDRYTIKINYNGRYLIIPFCDNKIQCSLQQFERWLNNWIVKDIKIGCGYKKKYQQYLLMLYGIIGGILLFIIYFVMKRKRNSLNKENNDQKRQKKDD